MNDYDIDNTELDDLDGALAEGDGGSDEEDKAELGEEDEEEKESEEDGEKI